MFNFNHAFSLILLNLILSRAQVLQFGKCAQVETLKYFNLEKFLGKWYEIERFPTWYEKSGNCAYKIIEACGRRIEIEHGFVRDDIKYILHLNSSYTPGDKAVFHIQESNIDPIGIPLSVINTDYTQYAIVYGCKNYPILGLKYLSAWLLSRTSTLDPIIIEKAYKDINLIPYASSAYLEVVQQDEDKCRYHWTAHVQADYFNTNDDEDILAE